MPSTRSRYPEGPVDTPTQRTPPDAIEDEVARFASVASHDLRNPLATVRGFLDLLVDSEPLSEDGLHLVSRALEVTTRMDALIDAIGGYGRARRSTLEPIAFAIGLAVEDALESLVHLTSPETSIEVGRLPQVVADPAAVTEALAAVLDNALRYQVDGEPTSVHVHGHIDGPLAIVTVDDTGPGLPEGSEDAVFEPFSKTINSRGHRTHGLGLAKAKVLVERSGGSIRAARRDDGRGTRITITLPAPG